MSEEKEDDLLLILSHLIAQEINTVSKIKDQKEKLVRASKFYTVAYFAQMFGEAMLELTEKRLEISPDLVTYLRGSLKDISSRNWEMWLQVAQEQPFDMSRAPPKAAPKAPGGDGRGDGRLN